MEKRKIYHVYANVLSLIILFSFNISFAQYNIYSAIDKYGNKITVQSNKRTGSGHRIYGSNLNVEKYVKQVTKDNIKVISQKLFEDYRDFLKVDFSDLKLLKATTDGSMWFVSYKQSYRNLPVFNTEIGYTINKNGDIVLMGADAFQNINISTIPNISKERAVEISKKSFKTDPVKNIESKLIIFPITESLNTRFYLAWKIRLNSLKPLKDSIFFVDAKNGDIIYSYSNLHNWDIHGNIKGYYYPEHNYDATSSSNFSTTHIIIYNALDQPIAEGNADNNGNYSINSSASNGNYYLSIPLQNSWIQLRDGNDDLITYTHAFTPPVSSVEYNHSWAADDGPNVRYHASKIHDYYKNTFSYNAMDYQMTASIDQGSGTNGLADGTNIFFGSQSGQYWARSSDVVYHEYTHNVIYSVYGGWIGDPNNGALEGSAMDEGLSDYFACTKNNNSVVGEDVGISRNLDNTLLYSQRIGNAHYDGQIIGGACWDLRQAVGHTISDNLVFRALQVSPHANNFTDYLYNVLIADDNYYSGLYKNQIILAFVNHGIGTHVSGAISSNTTWSGSYIVEANVNVNYNVALTITEGTFLFFNNSSSLTVNGTLNVTGTSSHPITFDFLSPNSSTLNGIKINNGGSADIFNAVIKNAYNGISITTPIGGSSSIQYSEIENCTNGITVKYGNKDADVNIANNSIHDIENYGISIFNPDHYGMNVEPSTSNNSIANCFFGINLNEASVDITSSEVSDCYYGIYLYRTNYAGGQPTIIDVHSHDNSNSGIILYYSSPKILNSEFDDNHYGVSCWYYSSPELGYAGTYGNNNIHDNFYGLYVYRNSNPFLGRQTCTIQGGNNKVVYNEYYNASVVSNSTVIAELNWWGNNPPQTLMIYADGTSSIDYTPWLISSPYKVVPNRSKSPEEYVFNKAFGNPPSTIDTTRPNSFDPKWPLFWKILYVRNLVDVEKYSFAQQICKNIINEYPDSSLSFYALDLLWKASQKNDEESFKSYLNTLKNKRIIKNLYGSAAIILSGYDNANRISSLDNLVNQYSSGSIGEAALFNKFLYYINEEKNIKMARAVSEKLDSLFPNSPVSLDAHLRLGDKVKNMVISKSGNVEKLLNEDNIPKKYALLGNYPNPFNPSTKIRYALPFNSDVEITIYNINGQIVKAFKYSSQSAGLYDVKWNGTNSNNQHVASGIYLYHFKAVSLEKNNEMYEKSAKLILMK